MTEQYALASTAAWLSSIGISHHRLLPHIYSGRFPTVNSRHCLGIAPQFLHSSFQTLPSRGLASLSRVCMTVTRIVLFSFSHLQLFVTSWTAAHQAFLSITNSWSLLKLISIQSVMPSNHLILCHPFLLLPSIFSSIRVFLNESVFLIRWPKYWSFSFNVIPSSEHAALVCFRMDWLDLLAWKWGRSGCDICHPIDRQGCFGLSGWLGGCPLPPSPLHVRPSRSCTLGRRGRPFLIEEDQSLVKGIRVAALPC